jgi:hypothetical protein
MAGASGGLTTKTYARGLTVVRNPMTAMQRAPLVE